jgi:GntR family transcriptional regulator
MPSPQTSRPELVMAGDEEGVEGCSARVDQHDTPDLRITYPHYLDVIMDREWNDSQPIYRQLHDRVVAMILDGVLNEGDPLPSVRTVALEFRVNPLTVLKGYQQLVDEQLVEKRRGRGMYINTGARALLLQGERQKFLVEEWPKIHATIQRLGFEPAELLSAAAHSPASGPAGSTQSGAAGSQER